MLVVIAFVCSIDFFVRLIGIGEGSKRNRLELRVNKNVEMRSSFDAPVFSYKLNVSFLA